MVDKAKLSRKKKKSSKKNDFSKNGETTTPDRNAPQNFESHKSIFDEGKKHIEELEPLPPYEKNKVAYYPNKNLLLEVIILLLFTVVVYSGTLEHSFHFDDAPNIWNNHFIQIDNLSLDELRKAAFKSVNHKRPVANISFALNYYFHGLEVKGYHLVNIFIHLLTGIMLFYFVKTTLNLSIFKDKYRKSRFIAFFTALIWLVHPLHTQSVTYIVQRMNSMAALFYIMAMLFYVKARLNPDKTKRILFFSVTFISGLLALGTKQNTITLPIFILLYEWYFFQDLRLKISKKQIFWIATICLVFITVLYIYLGTFTLSKIVSGYGGRPFSLVERLLTQPRVILHYISLLVVPAPSRLNVDYDFPLSYSLFSPPTTIIAILVIAGMLGLAIYTAQKNRLYSFCILWFLGNLLIESSIIPLEMVYEHRTYLPSMFAILMLVLIFERVAKNRTAITVFLIILTLILSFWTYERNKIWQDEMTFWTDIQKKSPNKARVNHHFGTELLNANRVDEAIPIFEKALRNYEKEIKHQTNVSSYKTSLHLTSLGIAYEKKRNYKKAILYLNRALEEFYLSASTHQYLGVSYAITGQPKKAVFHLSKALEYAKPQHSFDIGEKVIVVEINRLLGLAKKLLKEQEERELLKKKNK